MYKLHTLTGIAALATLSLTTVTQGATPFYEQDFSGAVTRAGTYGTLVYGDGQAVDDQEFGHGGQDGQASYQPPAFTTGVDGNMFMPSLYKGTQNRGMSTASTVYLDTSSWDAGDYTVTFDVADYTQVANSNHFGVYEGDNDGTLKLRLMTGSGAITYPFEDGSAGTVSFDEIGSGTSIAADGEVSYDFTLTDAGTTGDYLVLGWGNNSTGTLFSDSFSIDNITVVPEPSTYALIGGLLALGAVMLRRRR